MKKENITVLRKILYAVESGGQVYGKQNYGAFAGVGVNTPNEKAITIGAGQWYAEEARTLLLNIQKKYPKEFKKLDTTGIAADLNKSWGTYGVTKTSGNCTFFVVATDFTPFFVSSFGKSTFQREKKGQVPENPGFPIP